MGNISSEPTIFGGGGGYGYGGGLGSGNFPLFGLFGALPLNGLNGGGDLRNELLQQTIAFNNTANENKNAISEQISNAQSSVSAKLDGVSGALCNGFSMIANLENQLRYDFAIQTQAQTNYLSTTMTAGFQSIKDDMCKSKIADLERQLAVAEQGGPIVRSGAFVQNNPCNDHAWKQTIENHIIQIGSRLNAVAEGSQK